MAYIDRDGSNAIIAVYKNQQSVGQEFLDDNDPEVVAFLNPPAPTPAERVANITGGNDLVVVIFKMIFKLHNRMLAQEGQPPKTFAEFLIFLEGELE